MLPNFLVLGAAKAGTSSLCEYLKTHPQVYMSRLKEPNFFALDGTAPEYPTPELRESLAATQTPDLDSYQRLFADVDGETAIGEGSSWYLHSEKAPERIQHYVPNARMIVVLRNPIERAYSAYRMHKRLGTEPASTFAEALAQREQRRKTWDWGTEYLQPGFYFQHLSRYFERFPRDQIRVYLHEDYAANRRTTVRDVFGFLGVDPEFVPPNLELRYNTALSGQARRPWNWLFRKQSSSDESSSRAADLPDDVRAALIETYRSDIQHLQSLLGRDLSAWLQ